SNDQPHPEEESQSEDHLIIQSQSVHSNDQLQPEEYLNDHPQSEEEIQSKDFPIIKSMLAEHSYDQSQSEEHSYDQSQSEEESQSEEHSCDQSQSKEHSGEVQRDLLEQEKHLLYLEDFRQQCESFSNLIAFHPFFNITTDSSPDAEKEDLQLSNYPNLPKSVRRFVVNVITYQ
ncbi:hypothetical protein TUBRATIS_20140, partial [Tubulinosema ratisbonensis]